MISIPNGSSRQVSQHLYESSDPLAQRLGFEFAGKPRSSVNVRFLTAIFILAHGLYSSWQVLQVFQHLHQSLDPLAHQLGFEFVGKPRSFFNVRS